MKYGLPIFLLLSIVGSEAKDCSASDGYIKDHRDNVTDLCDYECGYAQCADVCINEIKGGQCGCSKPVNLNIDQYCCPDTLPENSTKCITVPGGAFCKYGTVLDKASSCKFTKSGLESTQNHCYNDYKSSEVVGPKSYYQCDNGQCVRASKMCRGYPLCDDSSDVKECDQNLQCSLYTDLSHNKTSLVSDLTLGHYLCDYSTQHNDGKYDTITRQDEGELDILSKKVEIDYSSIIECKQNTSNPNIGLPGYLCGETCLLPRDWCNDKIDKICGDFNANNDQLCSNTTFWDEKSCEVFGDSGLKSSVGKRCSGSLQQCIYPWYLTNNFFYETGVNKLLNI